MPTPPPDRPLARTDWLAAHLDDPQVRVVDVRWYLSGPRTGAGEYAASHLPGAVFLDVDRDLSSVGRGATGPGRHPLPRPDDFAESMARAGVGDERWVVAYDDAGGAVAARLWFLLRYFGHDTGLVLDGGLQAWASEGRRMTAEVPAPARARFTARPRPELIVNRAAVDALRERADALLLDARAPERFRGDAEPVDPIPGHIPGARSAPYSGNLAPAGNGTPGRFLSREALADRYAALGVGKDGTREVACYCGSGVTACHDLLALALSGLPGADRAQLYEGSWSDWARSGMPAARGDR